MLRPKVFVKNKKKVYIVDEICFVDDRVWVSEDNSFYEFYYYDEVEFLENTGAKDKNGNYIYTGNIVKDDDDIYVIKRSEVYKIFSIGNEKGYLFLDESRCREIEVIGNIYENKELLEDI